MSALIEIEAAVEQLPREQKEELFRFLAVSLRQSEGSRERAKLVSGPDGTLLLEAPPGAPLMTTELVKELLEDFP